MVAVIPARVGATCRLFRHVGLVALFRMVGRPGTRAVTVAPRGRRWCRPLARCAWLALAVAVLVVVCCLLALS